MLRPCVTPLRPTYAVFLQLGTTSHEYRLAGLSVSSGFLCFFSDFESWNMMTRTLGTLDASQLFSTQDLVQRLPLDYFIHTIKLGYCIHIFCL
jgi:hypothetical protein